MIGNALNNLGNVARAQGSFDEARTLYAESLEIYRVVGDKYALAYLFEDMGCLAAQQGESQRALRLVGAASSLREEIGGPLTPSQESKLDSALQPARQALSEEEQETASAAGRAMSLDEAVDYALAT
jgi:tetratricopeptide (TPR) repeat protein